MYGLIKSKAHDGDIEEEFTEISDKDLIGAELIAAFSFRSVGLEDSEPDELNEIEIRLKDGRILSLSACLEQITLVEWADKQPVKEEPGSR